MRATPRQWLLGGGLVLTLALCVGLALQPEDGAAVAPTAAPRRPAAAAAPPERAVTAGQKAADAARPAGRQPWAEAEPGQLAAWQPPPQPPAPPPQAIAPAPPPVAPLPPYQMIGRLVDSAGGQATEVALLSGPNKSLSVKRGDVIDGQWRVEQVSPQGVSLTWLPARLPQNIIFKAVP